MAIVLQSKEDLTKLCDILQSNENHKSKKLSPVGALKASLAGHWSYEAVVDRWPDVTSFILRPNIAKTQDFAFKYNDVYVYSGNKKEFRKFLELGEVLPSDYPYGIPVCPTDLVDVIEQKVISSGGHVERKGPFYWAGIHRMTDLQKYFKEKPHLAQFTFGPVREKDLEMIFNLWESQRKTTREYWLPLMKQIIKVHPCICAFDDKGHAVSWMLTNLDGCGFMAYTKPEYRNLNLKTTIGYMIMSIFPSYNYGYAPIQHKNKIKHVYAMDDDEFQFLQCTGANYKGRQETIQNGVKSRL